MANEEKTRIRGLLVEINNFPKLSADHQLHGCVRDTENVCKLLINKYSTAADDIRQLHNERATRKAVLDRLGESLSKLHPGALFIAIMDACHVDGNY